MGQATVDRLLKVSQRCPKCGCPRLLLTHVCVEEWVTASAGSLASRDRWYEDYTCTRCGLVERYALPGMPEKLEKDRVIGAVSSKAPYR